MLSSLKHNQESQRVHKIEKGLQVSKMLIFEHKAGKEMIALGLRNGEVLIKDAESLKNNQAKHHVKPEVEQF